MNLKNVNIDEIIDNNEIDNNEITDEIDNNEITDEIDNNEITDEMIKNKVSKIESMLPDIDTPDIINDEEIIIQQKEDGHLFLKFLIESEDFYNKYSDFLFSDYFNLIDSNIFKSILNKIKSMKLNNTQITYDKLIYNYNIKKSKEAINMIYEIKLIKEKYEDDDKYYDKLLKGYYVKQTSLNSMVKIGSKIKTNPLQVKNIINELNEELNDFENKFKDDDYKLNNDNEIKLIELIKYNNSVLNGCNIGYSQLDFVKLVSGTINILQAPIHNGKTLFLQNILLNNIMEGKNVLFLAGEMTTIEILSNITKSIHKKNINEITIDDLNSEKSMGYGKYEVYGVNSPDDFTINFIESHISKFKKEYGKLDLILIDYFQLINIDNLMDKNNGDNYDMIGKKISRKLKSKIGDESAMLGAVQVNREGIKKSLKGKNVTIADVGESINYNALANTGLTIRRCIDNNNVFLVNCFKNRKGTTHSSDDNVTLKLDDYNRLIEISSDDSFKNNSDSENEKNVVINNSNNKYENDEILDNELFN